MAVQVNYFHQTSTTQLLPQKTSSPSSRKKKLGQPTTTLQVKAVQGKAQQLIQSGTVRPIPVKEAANAMKSDGYVLLDIRPEWEREKAYVSGSVHVPLFIKDMDNGPMTLLKKWVHLGYIGLWTGQYFTMFNPQFLQQVQSNVPRKDTKLLVACGEGLRSMMAASKLHEEGYSNLGWLAGGFNRAGDDDFPVVEGTEKKLQYATIGGASYYFLKLILLVQNLTGNNQE